MFVVLVSAGPLIGQSNNSPATAQDSYAKHLKQLVDSDENARPTDANDPNAYKEQLRRLAQGDQDSSSQAPAGSPNSASRDDVPSSSTQAGITHRTVESISSEQAGQPTEAEGDVQNVGLRSDSTSIASSPVSAPGVVPASGNCDAYCQQLGQIAKGATPSYSPPSSDGQTLTNERNFIKNVAFDQIHIWESPFKLRPSDATWAIPFGLTTGALAVTDHDLSKQAATPGRYDTSMKLSDWGLYSFIGAGAGFYGMGLITGDEHRRETGLLSGEAFVNATLLAEALKVAFGRQRPFEGDGFGHIGKGGSSFPSEHAIGSWAIASVLAHEYPNPFMQFTAYGLASAVSLARVTAGQHFPSDVFVGATFGYLIGRKIYKDHHDYELGGSEYGTFVHERPLDAEHSGSAYVPLESWVYPVIDRLAALGIVHSNFDSERPFTRLECARITAEAAENAYLSASPDIQGMIDSLQREFSRETEVWEGGSTNQSAEIESIYTRATEIAGPVLRDGYHFGQTLYNDYGRPYGRGFNEITGFSARATSGPLVLYFRGEYQHAPGNPSYTPQQLSVMSKQDLVPDIATPFPSVDKFQVLDAYIGLNFKGNQFSLGQQSLWWGPGTAGAFLLSNNAVPLNMIRLASTSPVNLPLLSWLVGPMRYDAFLGQTGGYNFILSPRGLSGPHLGTQPFIQGQRFSFKPTPNFEFGFSRTAVFGGTGYPLTTHYFFLDTFSLGNTIQGAADKPGDRRSGVDITYRVPPFRDWLTFYLDEFSEDEFSPLLYPRRSAMHPGIYLAKLPKLPKMDLRVEGIYTDIPSFAPSGYFYWNLTFLSGYRKDGNILGDWIGREGRGVFATSKLWLSAKNNLQFGYREATVDKEFLLGGRYQDFSVTGNFPLRQNVSASAMVQYEHWYFPLLFPQPQNNFVTSLQLTYVPSWKVAGK